MKKYLLLGILVLVLCGCKEYPKQYVKIAEWNEDGSLNRILVGKIYNPYYNTWHGDPLMVHPNEHMIPVTGLLENFWTPIYRNPDKKILRKDYNSNIRIFSLWEDNDRVREGKIYER